MFEDNNNNIYIFVKYYLDERQLSYIFGRLNYYFTSLSFFVSVNVHSGIIVSRDMVGYIFKNIFQREKRVAEILSIIIIFQDVQGDQRQKEFIMLGSSIKLNVNHKISLKEFELVYNFRLYRCRKKIRH